ncbi:hypothetical protein IAT40_002625 [Kwoniella sp. CBS 6097]
MTLPELSPELWPIIFKYCLEKGKPGVFVPHDTLVAALQVNKTFFELVGPILYRTPVVHNLRNFFQGACNDNSTGGQTKDDTDIDANINLPSIVNIHMTWLTWNKDWPIVWGTTNRISITEELDVHCRAWSKRSFPSSIDTASSSDAAPSADLLTKKHRLDLLVTPEETSILDSNDHHQQVWDLSSEEDQAGQISSYLFDSYWAENSMQVPSSKRKGQTVVEVYGFEKFLPLPEWTSDLATLPEPNDSGQAHRKIDLSSWSAYRDSRHPEA